MVAREVWVIGIAGWMLATSALANPAVPSPNAVLGLDMSDPACTVASAVLAAARDQSVGEIRSLDHQAVIADKFQKLMDSRTWKPHAPMGEQMTPSEANDFGNLQEQTKIGLLTMVLEAKRGRDIRVLGEMADIAKRMQADYQLPEDQKSEEYQLVLFLMLKDKFPLPENDEVATMYSTIGKCSLQNSLISQAKRVVESIDGIPGFESANADMNMLVAKYGTPFDRSKLNDNDKVLLDRTSAAIKSVLARQNYYKDLLFISRLEAVSILQRDARLRSQYEAPGDLDHINVVWNSWLREGKITEDQNELSKVLNLINEKFPTEVTKDMADAQNVNK